MKHLNHSNISRYLTVVLLPGLVITSMLSFAQTPPFRGDGSQQGLIRNAPLPRDLQANNPPTVILDNSTSAMAQLGETLFFDTNLSNPVGQSCASCHAPEAAFTEPNQQIPTSEGAITGHFGNRNTPTVNYAAFIPPFQFNTNIPRRGGPRGANLPSGFSGGLFLDGRANTLEDQAKGPFLNPLEMNNPNPLAVIEAVRLSSYASEFQAVFGEAAFDNVDLAFDQVAMAIAAFERSPQFSPFSSKFDAVQNREARFTASEQRGQNLFFGRASCSTCHSSGNNRPQVFSDFRYENIGVPANADNPFYQLDNTLNPDGSNFVDLGLGSVVGFNRENGKFRIPTLRNITETAPYMHNGVFTTLEQVVDFYNRRDVDQRFGPAEVPQNVSRRGGIGNLRLNPQQLQDLVAFLHTLAD